MKEVVAEIKANITYIYNIDDDAEPKSLDDIRKEMDDAMRGKKPFVMDTVSPISVKNFITKE